MAIIGLSEEEKRERNRLAAKRYREKLKEKAKKDPKAQEKAERAKYNHLKGSAISFIKNHLKKEDLTHIKEVIKEREEKLKKKK